jgi:hypothetical protein
MKTVNNLPAPIPGDGWGDAATEASNRMIRGQLLTFSDWRWYAGETVVEEKKQLVALETVAAWVKWKDGKPLWDQMILREPGRRLPDRDEIGDLDQSLWETDGRGERRDPWQNTRFVHLECPRTAEPFTFSTSTYGGRDAVSMLGEQIIRMRARYPNAKPVIETGAAQMNTKHGRKSKPVLKVVGWTGIGGNEVEANPPKQLPPVPAPEEPSLPDYYENEDSIPF